MSGVLPDFELDALRAIFGDQRAAHMPASWTVDLYDGDPAEDGAELPDGTFLAVSPLPADGGYASVVKANTTANFPTDPDDPSGLLLTVDFGTATGEWPVDATHLVLSASGAPKVSLQLGEAVVVAQAGVTVKIEQPIYWNGITLLGEVG